MFTAACTESADEVVPEQVTFREHVAAVIYGNCSTCHRPGQSAPFSFSDYESVKKRASMIELVTQNRYMPPWLPESGHGDFVGDRRLTDVELEVIRRWVESGCPEGDAVPEPEAPNFSDEWFFGEPDLVATMPAAYEVRAEGTDVFRNFVVPVPIASSRYVRAIEFRPGNPRVLHHAVVLYDRTGTARHKEGLDGQPGYDGMLQEGLEFPDGHFLGWTPGKLPTPPAEGIAWRLEPGTDLVFDLHMLPTGKPEPLRASVGLYFTDEEPTRHPYLLRLGTRGIVIPAGERNHWVEADYVLPVDVDLLGLYPHAHYLGKEMLALALLPDGREEPILRIDDWDFNWQDDYVFAQPIRLPKGTRLSMRLRYDNSKGNARNPSNPPRRVLYGSGSGDEMGDLWLQLLPTSRADFDALRRDSATREARRKAADFQLLSEARPNDVETRFGLSEAYRQVGRDDDAIEELRAVLRLDPAYADAHNNLGVLLRRRDAIDEAVTHFRRAIESRPRFAGALGNLGSTLFARGQHLEAHEFLRRAVDEEPYRVETRHELGEVLVALDRLPDAIAEFRRTIAMRSDYLAGRTSLAMTLDRAGHHAEALERFREVSEARPDWAAPWTAMTRIIATDSNADPLSRAEACRFGERALRLSRNRDPVILDVLAMAYATAGRFDEAVRSAERAVSLLAATNNHEAARDVSARLDLYRRRQAYTER